MSDITVTVQDGVTVDVTVVDGNSVTVESPASSSITVTSKGPKGDTGLTGATGATGPAGADGEGVIAGGSENQFLQKNSATDYDTKWSAYTLPAADGDEGQVLTTDGAGAVTFAYPQTISENVKNVSGGILYKGTPVHVTGSVGNLAEVIAADAATNYPAHFVLDQDLADEGEGQGIALGFINNVDVPDASIYSEGQTVYLGASGGWVTTKPTGTNAIQNLGIIIKVNVSGNKISGIVMGAGRANDVPNIPNGQTWIGNASGVATPTALATVATTGAYSDLSGTPTIPSGNLVDDTTPQLGGDLDVNGNKITSASNGDITIDPDGTGAIIFKSDDIQFDGAGGLGVGKIKLYETDILGSNFIALSAPLSVTSDVTLTLPDGDGTSGQALTTNGAGTLSWGTVLDGNSDTLNGVTSFRPQGATAAQLAIYDNDESNYVILRAPANLTSNTTYYLPAIDGSSGQVLQTNGSGSTSWTSVGTVDTSGTPAVQQLAVFTDSDTVEGDANLTWTGIKLVLRGTLDADRITSSAKTSLASAGNYAVGSEILGTVYSSSALTGDAGEVHYLGSATSVAANASTEASGSGMLVVVTDAEDRDELLTRGVVRVSTTLTSASIGDIVYLDTTAGAVTTTAPTGSGNVVRVVGHVVKPSANMIYFNPSSDWIVVA